MEIMQAILTALGSIITLFILTKIMGKREMSQLSMFDYINGITIGSIAAEMATCEFTDVIRPFVAMIVYAIFITMIAIATSKSLKLRHFLTGKCLILYNNGSLDYKNLKKSKMDINEFLTQCRVSGYFDLSQLQTVILEPNGKLSFLPLSMQRPVTGTDLNLQIPQDMLVANIIIDGKILDLNLGHTGKDRNWLTKSLSQFGVTDVKEVLLATVDINNKLNVYKKTNDIQIKDILD